MVTLGNSLYFPAVDFIRASVGRAGIKQGASQLPVVVDCRFILGADYTAAKVCWCIDIPWKISQFCCYWIHNGKWLLWPWQCMISLMFLCLGIDWPYYDGQGIASLIDDFHKRKQKLLFYKPRAAVLSVLHGVGLEDFIHVDSQEQLDSILKGKNKHCCISCSNDFPLIYL